jgi:hypothetical protein
MDDGFSAPESYVAFGTFARFDPDPWFPSVG